MTSVSPQEQIPFNLTTAVPAEVEHVAASLASGTTASGGPWSKRAEALLAELTGAEEVLLTTSCTAALELAGLLCVEPGDVVVVPSFTFSTTALAFVRAGARIAFCDVEPDTLGLDPAHLAELLEQHGDRVRAVVPVHYGGIACRIEEIARLLADRPGCRLVEDNAHGLTGRWQGRLLGSFGALATQSFHATKNVVCGEGGALLVNDPALVARARVLFEKGTDRRAFFLGQVDKYSWRDTGSSFALSDLLAAYLTAQLESVEEIQSRRRAAFAAYQERLEPVADRLGLRLPVVPEGAEGAAHLYYVLAPDGSTRDRLLDDLREQGVQATFHYVPLHSSEAGRRFAADPAVACPVTDDVSARLLRLPFFTAITESQVDRVVDSLVRASHRAVTDR